MFAYSFVSMMPTPDGGYQTQPQATQQVVACDMEAALQRLRVGDEVPFMIDLVGRVAFFPGGFVVVAEPGRPPQHAGVGLN